MNFSQASLKFRLLTKFYLNRDTKNFILTEFQTEIHTEFRSVDEAMKELKKCKFDDESNHVKRLLEVTFLYRRDFIEHNAENVQQILEKFSQLRRYKFVSIY